MRPTRYARIGGALYLVIIIAGIVGPLLTRDQLIVPGDADATAHNIAASPLLWRLGIAVDVVMRLCDVPVMLILFLLLSPVNKNVARLALLRWRPRAHDLVDRHQHCEIPLSGHQLDSRRCGLPVTPGSAVRCIS